MAVIVNTSYTASASLDREGHISSKDIAGTDEATFEGNCKGQGRECKSSDEGDGTEEEHF